MPTDRQHGRGESGIELAGSAMRKVAVAVGGMHRAASAAEAGRAGRCHVETPANHAMPMMAWLAHCPHLPCPLPLVGGAEWMERGCRPARPGAFVSIGMQETDAHIFRPQPQTCRHQVIASLMCRMRIGAAHPPLQGVFQREGPALVPRLRAFISPTCYFWMRLCVLLGRPVDAPVRSSPIRQEPPRQR